MTKETMDRAEALGAAVAVAMENGLQVELIPDGAGGCMLGLTRGEWSEGHTRYRATHAALMVQIAPDAVAPFVERRLADLLLSRMPRPVDRQSARPTPVEQQRRGDHREAHLVLAALVARAGGTLTISAKELLAVHPRDVLVTMNEPGAALVGCDFTIRLERAPAPDDSPPATTPLVERNLKPDNTVLPERELDVDADLDDAATPALVAAERDDGRPLVGIARGRLVAWDRGVAGVADEEHAESVADRAAQGNPVDMDTFEACARAAAPGEWMLSGSVLVLVDRVRALEAALRKLIADIDGSPSALSEVDPNPARAVLESR
jgi:hypothetical protein